MKRNLRALWVLGMPSIVLVGCGLFAGPEPVAITPWLDRLDFGISGLQSDQAIELFSTVAAGSDIPDGRPFITVVLRSPNSEITVRLASDRCKAPRGQVASCNLIGIALELGREFDELQPLLDELNLQLIRTAAVGTFRRGTLYSFDQLADAVIPILLSHPAVMIAERPPITDGQGNPVPLGGGILQGAARTANDPHNPLGGLVISAGDTITATYVQPDGSVFEVSARITDAQ